MALKVIGVLLIIAVTIIALWAGDAWLTQWTRENPEKVGGALMWVGFLAIVYLLQKILQELRVISGRLTR